MRTPSHHSTQFAVFDDFLQPEAFVRLWAYLCRQEFRSVWSSTREKNLSLTEGQAMEGEAVFSDVLGARGGHAAQSYPTGSAVDGLIAAIRDLPPASSQWIGTYGVDWSHFTVRPFLYPAGSSLAWHYDGGPRRAAFTYFAHQVWSSSWGGELLLSAPPSRRRRGSRNVAIGDRPAEEEAFEAGFGTYITPKPNRLVLISAAVAHRICRVDERASGNPRVSVAGFFLDLTRGLRE
jgi:hypothetical protein